jgi:hypothetical protein
MSIPASLIPQLVINAAGTTGALWYLPRAVRRRKNRTVTIVVLAMALFGLWVNLHGYYISGWQGGFRRDKA